MKIPARVKIEVKIRVQGEDGITRKVILKIPVELTRTLKIKIKAMTNFKMRWILKSKLRMKVKVKLELAHVQSNLEHMGCNASLGAVSARRLRQLGMSI